MPWIFLGSLALNLLVPSSGLDDSTAVAAVAIASASTLQSWLGRSVLNRTIGPNAGLDTARQIIGYLASAPAICLVSASVAVPSLVLFEQIRPDQIFLAWATWAVGDTLGMVSLFPIMMALFGTPDSMWKGRRLVIISIMSIMLGIVCLGYIGFGRTQSAETTSSFRFQAERVAHNIQEHLTEQEFILTQLDATLSLSDGKPINREAFRALVAPALRRFPMLQAIEWAPEITRNRRVAFEAQQREFFPEFAIRSRNDDGILTVASDQALVYPVTYIEPLKGNEKAIGFDLGSDPARKAAVSEALQSHSPIATEPITLIQEQGSQTGILLMQYIHAGANAPGLLLTVLRVGDFITTLLPDGNEIELSLADTKHDKIVYGVSPSRPSPIELTRPLQFGGRQYQLSITPSVGFVAAHHDWQSWALLVAGALADGLLGATLLLITGTTNRVRCLVEAGTQELASKSDLLQAVIDTVPVRVFWKDRSLHYLGCNPIFARDAGITDPSELIGKTDYDLAWAKEADLYRADDMTVIESGTAKINFEEPQTTSAGHTVWLRTSKVPLKDQHNNVIGVLGLYEDVSEQRDTAARLRQSEERFNLAMQAANDGLWDWNIQAQTTYFSPYWKGMLGYADHELENSFATWERLVEKDGYARTMELIQHCLNGTSDGFTVEFRMCHKQGYWVDILSRAILVRDEQGKPLRMVGTHVDITDRKATAQELEHTAQALEQQNMELEKAHQQALAATEAKSAFLASMSHEIRTPLHAIIAMADLLRDTPLNREQEDYVQRFDRAAEHLLSLVNNILDLSKIEAGQMHMESILFSPVDVVTSVHNLLMFTAQAKQLSLQVDRRPGIPAAILGDPTRLRQVLMNLISNAIKFTDRGQVVLTVESLDSSRLRFTIADTGIGIPEDKLPSIFENFTQVDPTTTRRFGGTGLGLAISHRLVAMMGGHLTVSSTLGVGTTFVFTIRASTSLTADPGLSKPSAIMQQDAITPSTHPLRMLVVDDLEDNRDIIALFLKHTSCTIDMAEHGLSAVEKFRQESYDLVLMDVQMPVMDGLQATAAIREWERAQHRRPTPILALTAHALAEERDKSLAAGCTAHLTKPIKKEALLNAIAQHTGQHTVTDQAA